MRFFIDISISIYNFIKNLLGLYLNNVYYEFVVHTFISISRYTIIVLYITKFFYKPMYFQLFILQIILC